MKVCLILIASMFLTLGPVSCFSITDLNPFSNNSKPSSKSPEPALSSPSSAVSDASSTPASVSSTTEKKFTPSEDDDSELEWSKNNTSGNTSHATSTPKSSQEKSTPAMDSWPSSSAPVETSSPFTVVVNPEDSTSDVVKAARDAEDHGANDVGSGGPVSNESVMPSENSATENVTASVSVIPNLDRRDEESSDEDNHASEEDPSRSSSKHEREVGKDQDSLATQDSLNNSTSNQSSPVPPMDSSVDASGSYSESSENSRSDAVSGTPTLTPDVPSNVTVEENATVKAASSSDDRSLETGSNSSSDPMLNETSSTTENTGNQSLVESTTDNNITTDLTPEESNKIESRGTLSSESPVSKNQSTTTPSTTTFNPKTSKRPSIRVNSRSNGNTITISSLLVNVCLLTMFTINC